METSCFSKYKKTNGVSIALKTPNWFKGKKYPDLFPSWMILNNYRKDKDEEAYTRAYIKTRLSKLNPYNVLSELKDSVLLCYESPGTFCHRRIVAEWFKNEIGVIVPEYKFKKRLIL